VLLSGYESNATLEITGQAAGLRGNYTGIGDGPGQIGSVLDIFTGRMVNLTLSDETQTIVGAPRGLSGQLDI
jgi:hypothetical protein